MLSDAIISAIGIADVAAGEGALQTWSIRSVCERIASYTGAKNHASVALSKSSSALWVVFRHRMVRNFSHRFYRILSEAKPKHRPTGAISLLFLLVAPWILVNFLKVPIISVWDSGKDDWLIARRWLWKVEMEHVLHQSLPMPLIEEERDNEGGVKYRCLLRLTSRVIEFAKYRRREQAELACNHQQHHLVALLLGAACRHFLGLTLCRRDTASMPQER